MLEEVIAGFTFTGFTTAPPTIPGLQVMGIFGSTKDGKNGNRAPGGPTFTNLTAGPVIGTNFITVNTGVTANAQGYDTGLVETTAFAPGGWTCFVVARMSAGAGNAGLMTIGTTNGMQFVMNPANTNVSSHPSVYVSGAAYALTADNSLDLGTGISQANWRMYSLSFPGGASQFYTLRDLTGGLSKTTTTAQTRSGLSTNHFCIGQISGTTGVNSATACDISAFGIAGGVLSLTVQNQIRTWWQGVLAGRGVTGF